MMHVIRLNLYLKIFTRTLKVCLVAMLAQLVIACSDLSTGDVALVSGEQQGVTIPKDVRATVIKAEGTLEVVLYCNEGKQSMTISGDVARGSCTGMSTINLHTIRVEFKFTSDTFGGPFLLATATKEGVRAELSG